MGLSARDERMDVWLSTILEPLTILPPVMQATISRPIFDVPDVLPKKARLNKDAGYHRGSLAHRAQRPTNCKSWDWMRNPLCWWIFFSISFMHRSTSWTVPQTEQRT